MVDSGRPEELWPTRGLALSYVRIRWCSAWLLRVLVVAGSLALLAFPFSRPVAALVVSLAVLPVAGIGSVLLLDVFVAAARAGSGALPVPLSVWLRGPLGSGVQKALGHKH